MRADTRVALRLAGKKFNDFISTRRALGPLNYEMGADMIRELVMLKKVVIHARGKYISEMKS